jgi:hypothetical protein
MFDVAETALLAAYAKKAATTSTGTSMARIMAAIPCAARLAADDQGEADEEADEGQEQRRDVSRNDDPAVVVLAIQHHSRRHPWCLLVVFPSRT